MDIPERCKDCTFLKFLYKDSNEQFPACMLGHTFTLAAGCPNKRKDSYSK